MNTRIIKLPDIPKVPPVFIPRLRGIHPEILMIILLFIWLFGPIALQSLDRAAGNIDQSIWLLVVLSLISFLLILGICWQLLQHYLAAAGLKKGQPWCAAYISWVYAQMGYGKPRSGWCPDLFPASRLARSALPGNVLGIYFAEYKRIAHVGLIVQQKGCWIISVEGNTNVTGRREGDGVYKKIRHIRTIRSIADWITERRKVLAKEQSFFLPNRRLYERV